MRTIATKSVPGSLVFVLPLFHLLFVSCLQSNLNDNLSTKESPPNMNENSGTLSDPVLEMHHVHATSSYSEQIQADLQDIEKTPPSGHVIGLSTISRKYWDPENNWYFEVNDVTGNLHGSPQLGAYSNDDCSHEFFRTSVDVAHCSAEAFSNRRPVFARGGDNSGWTRGSQAVTLGSVQVMNKRYLRNANGDCELSSDTESYCARSLEVLPDFPTVFLTQGKP